MTHAEFPVLSLAELEVVSGGQGEGVCTFDNPTGQPQYRQSVTSATPRQELNVPDPKQTMFPPFRGGRPPTEADGRAMADKIRGVGQALGF
jgi:hypothetical protein